MKIKLLIFTIIPIFIYFLFTNTCLITSSIENTSLLFLNNILPLLFPMFIITKILLNYNLPYYFQKLFKNSYIYLFIICLFSGIPNNIIIIKDLYNKHQISLKTANSYLQMTFFINPLFLYTILHKTFSYKTTILIIVSHYLSNLIIYIFIHPTNELFNKNIEKDFSTTLTNAISDAAFIFLKLYLIMLLFNILVLFIPSTYSGLFEITKGLTILSTSNLSNLNKIILAIIFINFGGLSIHTQIKSILIDTSLSYNNFLISRFYQIIINLILFYLLHLITYGVW